MSDKMIAIELASAHSPYTMHSPYKPNETQPGHKHIPYSYLSRDKIAIFDRSFAVVRNPWSRMVSLYNHADTIYPQMNKTWYGQEKLSWDEFFDRIETFRMNSSYYWNHPYDQWASQLDWISIGSKIKTDVLRFENIQDDINSYFDNDIILQKHNILTYDRDYKEYYTEEQKQKIANWFRMDINYWGFTFESGATRNYWTK